MELILTSRTNVKIATLVKDESGNFVYRPLKTGETSVTAVTNSDVTFTASTKASVIYFEYNSYELSSENKKMIDDFAEKLKKDSKLKLEINTHADSRADDWYNNALSKKRLNSIKDYLLTKGISETKITGKSHGEKKLINKCVDGVECSDDDHRLNRRAELSLIK
jgi:outer membrane protein OmpA-like peptidoglycan-associated protein